MKKKSPKKKWNSKHSRRYWESFEMFDSKSNYDVDSALGILKGFKPVKFNQTVELSVHLGVDPKKADQIVRGSVSLPKGIGKTLRVIAFADGEIATKAKEAGAIEVGGDDLAQKIQKDGWLDFDVAIAHPSMMRYVGRLGKILGPAGKMPSPKSGTVIDDVATAVQEFTAGKVEFRTDSGGNIHIPVGKIDFSDEDLRTNITFFLDHLRALKPAAAKGDYFLNISISSTMSPGVPLAQAV